MLDITAISMFDNAERKGWMPTNIQIIPHHCSLVYMDTNWTLLCLLYFGRLLIAPLVLRNIYLLDIKDYHKSEKNNCLKIRKFWIFCLLRYLTHPHNTYLFIYQNLVPATQ